MERLNDALLRSGVRRQPLSEQRPYPGTRTSQTQGQRPRRATPDHISNSSPRYSQGASPAPYSHASSRVRNHGNHGQSEDRRSGQSENHSYIEPITRTDYPTYPQPSMQSPLSQMRRAPLNGSATFQPHPQPHHDVPHIQPLQPRPTSDYYPLHSSDEYAPRMHSDVIEEWEEDGMGYGDWEHNDNDSLLYDDEEIEESEQLPANYQSNGYPPHPTVDTEPTPRITRNLHDMRLASAIATQQAMPSSQRVTQPLDPRIANPMRRERELSRSNEARVLRSRSAQSQSQREPIQHQQVVNTPTPTPPAVKMPCPKCKGAGYLRADVPFGHPNFGKPIACECKEAEKKEKRRQQLRQMSNMDAFHTQNFGTFISRTPGVQEAYDTALAYADNPYGWLLLVGPNGCGKTHLAASIANQTLDNGAVVLFEAVPDLLDHLRAAFAPTANEMYDQLFSKMREAELLVLDDLGAQQSSPWANEKLFQLLNYRYNLNMPTVITANHKGLQGIDERIRSRLSDNSLVIKIDMDRARDFRPTNTRRR
jgi:DNA replication protein DnaC